MDRWALGMGLWRLQRHAESNLSKRENGKPRRGDGLGWCGCQIVLLSPCGKYCSIPLYCVCQKRSRRVFQGVGELFLSGSPQKCSQPPESIQASVAGRRGTMSLANLSSPQRLRLPSSILNSSFRKALEDLACSRLISLLSIKEAIVIAESQTIISK